MRLGCVCVGHRCSLASAREEGCVWARITTCCLFFKISKLYTRSSLKATAAVGEGVVHLSLPKLAMGINDTALLCACGSGLSEDLSFFTVWFFLLNRHLSTTKKWFKQLNRVTNGAKRRATASTVKVHTEFLYVRKQVWAQDKLVTHSQQINVSFLSSLPELDSITFQMCNCDCEHFLIW